MNIYLSNLRFLSANNINFKDRLQRKAWNRCRTFEKMILSKEFRTSWSKEHPPYGAFDEYVVFESLENHNKFFIRPEEFDFMMGRLFDRWKEGKIGYIQILKEWNELSGYNDIEELPTTVDNIQEFIEALKLVEGVDRQEFATMTDKDLKELIDFLVAFNKEGFLIRKD